MRYIEEVEVRQSSEVAKAILKSIPNPCSNLVVLTALTIVVGVVCDQLGVTIDQFIDSLKEGRN